MPFYCVALLYDGFFLWQFKEYRCHEVLYACDLSRDEGHRIARSKGGSGNTEITAMPQLLEEDG